MGGPGRVRRAVAGSGGVECGIARPGPRANCAREGRRPGRMARVPSTPCAVVTLHEWRHSGMGAFPPQDVGILPHPDCHWVHHSRQSRRRTSQGAPGELQSTTNVDGSASIDSAGDRTRGGGSARTPPPPHRSRREEVQAENHSRDPAPARHAPRRPELTVRASTRGDGDCPPRPHGDHGPPRDPGRGGSGRNPTAGALHDGTQLRPSTQQEHFMRPDAYSRLLRLGRLVVAMIFMRVDGILFRGAPGE